MIMKNQPVDLNQLTQYLMNLRSAVEKHFSKETVSPTHTNYKEGSSAGHCAAVAIIVHVLFGGEMVSTYVSGESHWYNRITFSGSSFDVDLTGDQFGFPSIQIAEANLLYANSRIRNFEELQPETLRRALTLACRAGFVKISRSFCFEHKPGDLIEWIQTYDNTPIADDF